MASLYLPAAVQENNEDCQDHNADMSDCQKTEPSEPAIEDSSAARNAMTSPAEFDWLPRSQLDAEALKDLPRYYKGDYQEPVNTSPSAGIPFDQADLEASADTSEMLENEKVRMLGNVVLSKGDIRIKADEIELDQINRRLKISGNLEVRDEGVLLRADEADINADDATGTLSNAQYVIHQAHIHGEADQITRESDNIATIDNGTYTRCEPENDSWHMEARAIELNLESGVGTARGAVLRIKNIPVLYTPRISFPIDNQRRSGFLWPTFSSAKGTGGADITVPYYININPNWDSTVAPRFISKRGTMAEVELRHLNKYSYWEGDAAYLDDELYGDKRWMMSLQENGSIGNNWTHKIDYGRVSDDDYLNDLSNSNFSLKRKSHILQQGQLVFQNEAIKGSARVSQYQTIDILATDPYQLLPQLEIATRQRFRSFQPEWLLRAQYSQFDAKDDNRVTGSRLYLEPGVSFPMRWTSGFIVPTAKYRASSYSLKDNNDPNFDMTDESPSVGAGMFSLDSGLVFERESDWFGRKYTQTLEPRLYYLYSEYEDQTDIPLFDTQQLSFDYNQLYRDTRFAGYDRIPDANQASIGLTSRLIDRDTGAETFRISIGQIQYFTDRRVNLDEEQAMTNSSDFSAEISWRANDNLRAVSSLVWNTDNSHLNQTAFALRYLSDTGAIFNAAYRLRKDDAIQVPGGALIDNDIEQYNVSGIIPIGSHWAAVAKWNYDKTNDRDLEQLLGVEYNTCCWKVSLLYQEGIDGNNERENGVYFQVQLKGLGGTGEKVDGILRNSIVGYRERERYDR
ncbi:MAG: LPS-assembly protein LptD [Pseudomonadales bacterium]